MSSRSFPLWLTLVATATTLPVHADSWQLEYAKRKEQQAYSSYVGAQVEALNNLSSMLNNPDAWKTPEELRREEETRRWNRIAAEQKAREYASFRAEQQRYVEEQERRAAEQRRAAEKRRDDFETRVAHGDPAACFAALTERLTGKSALDGTFDPKLKRPTAAGDALRSLTGEHGQFGHHWAAALDALTHPRDSLYRPGVLPYLKAETQRGYLAGALGQMLIMAGSFPRARREMEVGFSLTEEEVRFAQRIAAALFNARAQETKSDLNELSNSIGRGAVTPALAALARRAQVHHPDIPFSAAALAKIEEVLAGARNGSISDPVTFATLAYPAAAPVPDGVRPAPPARPEAELPLARAWAGSQEPGDLATLLYETLKAQQNPSSDAAVWFAPADTRDLFLETAYRAVEATSHLRKSSMNIYYRSDAVALQAAFDALLSPPPAATLAAWDDHIKELDSFFPLDAAVRVLADIEDGSPTAWKNWPLCLHRLQSALEGRHKPNESTKPLLHALLRRAPELFGDEKQRAAIAKFDDYGRLAQAFTEDRAARTTPQAIGDLPGAEPALAAFAARLPELVTRVTTAYAAGGRKMEQGADMKTAYADYDAALGALVRFTELELDHAARSRSGLEALAAIAAEIENGGPLPAEIPQALGRRAEGGSIVFARTVNTTAENTFGAQQCRAEGVASSLLRYREAAPESEAAALFGPLSFDYLSGDKQGRRAPDWSLLGRDLAVGGFATQTLLALLEARGGHLTAPLGADATALKTTLSSLRCTLPSVAIVRTLGEAARGAGNFSTPHAVATQGLAHAAAVPLRTTLDLMNLTEARRAALEIFVEHAAALPLPPDCWPTSAPAELQALALRARAKWELAKSTQPNMRPELRAAPIARELGTRCAAVAFLFDPDPIPNTQQLVFEIDPDFGPALIRAAEMKDDQRTLLATRLQRGNVPKSAANWNALLAGHAW